MDGACDDNMHVIPLLKKSSELMKGYKLKLFILDISFIGWEILCILSMGLGFLWLIPYMQTTYGNFYDSVKTNENLS